MEARARSLVHFRVCGTPRRLRWRPDRIDRAQPEIAGAAGDGGRAETAGSANPGDADPARRKSRARNNAAARALRVIERCCVSFLVRARAEPGICTKHD